MWQSPCQGYPDTVLQPLSHLFRDQGGLLISIVRSSRLPPQAPGALRLRAIRPKLISHGGQWEPGISSNTTCHRKEPCQGIT